LPADGLLATRDDFPPSNPQSGISRVPCAATKVRPSNLSYGRQRKIAAVPSSNCRQVSRWRLEDGSQDSMSFPVPGRNTPHSSLNIQVSPGTASSATIDGQDRSRVRCLGATSVRSRPPISTPAGERNASTTAIAANIDLDQNKDRNDCKIPLVASSIW
jgi:hypothetical protein